MRVERLSGIEQVDAAAWRALEPPDFPFFDFGFLRALITARNREGPKIEARLLLDDGSTLRIHAAGDALIK